jgi:sugar phosphate isomerase/epimerase
MSHDIEPDEDRMQAQRREWKRLDDLAAEIASERATMQTDIGKVLQDGPPSPWIVDVGIYTSRRDRDAIQREEDRITRLERMGR